MKTVKVQGCDGVVVEVEVPVVAMCVTIKTMLDDLGAKDEEGEEIIPLPIHSDIINKIFQWSRHHLQDPPPPNEDDHVDVFNTTVSSWDKEFLDVGPEMLLRLFKAASFLNLKGLMYMAAKTLASLVMGKNAEEIRQVFHVKEELDPGPAEAKPLLPFICNLW